MNAPINVVFTDTGEMLVADAGVTDGNGKVLRHTQTGFVVVADGFSPPLTGINQYNGNVYVSHRGFITVIKPDGQKEDILAGLPSWGDHHNNRVVFGPDGKMYFGQGTATNSGIVGEDNRWVVNGACFGGTVGTCLNTYPPTYKLHFYLGTGRESSEDSDSVPRSG